MARQNYVIIKGTKHGLAILLDDRCPYPKVLAELMDRIRRADRFFRGARVTVDLGRRDVDSDQIDKLASMLARYEITLQGVVAATTGRAVLKELASESLDVYVGLPSALERPLLDAEIGDALLIRRTLESGQSVEYQGHICVVGDVKAGAELVAGGDVVVWGSLRGRVHAGAEDNDGAVVCAIVLVPEQLRIARTMGGVIDERPQRSRPPEVALVRDGLLVVEPWGKASL